MSHYSEADEAQHGHYNDGYSPYADQPEDNLNLSESNPVRRPHSLHPEPNVSDTSRPPSMPGFDAGQALVLRRDFFRDGIPMRGLYDLDATDARMKNDVGSEDKSRPATNRPKTMRTVELVQGNLVMESALAVPPELLEMCQLKDDREFTHMRYSAATCDPNNFKDEGFTLRQMLYDPPRRTELFIVMTMYNEDEELFTASMHSVMKNIAYLCKRNRSKTWGEDGWKRVVVCIVSDGRLKVNPRTLRVLTTIGVYQDGLAKNVVNGKPVTAHIYEYTTQIAVTPELLGIEGAERGVMPVQIIFCLKEKNQKKINSHRWFFNAFGPILQPNVCVLLDVGTVPGPTSIYRLWRTFDVNHNVGGACGEIVALKGKNMRNVLNPLVAAQNFEYKMSNILDKPLESLFGYITVLPGAFSAYRYRALQNDQNGEGPLQKYFLGESMHYASSLADIEHKGSADTNVFTANMYLAEDRILCWELVSKRGQSWILTYIKSAYAVTDVPDQIPELISQRRRWSNGSLFAAVHSIFKFHYIYRSSHSWMRKVWIHVELLYQCLNLFFAWFALAHFYISFVILTESLEDPTFHLGHGIHVLNIVLNYLYFGLLITCYVLALGNRPQGAKWAYTLTSVGFAIIMLYMTVASFYLAVKGVEGVMKTDGPLTPDSFFTNSIFRNIVTSLLATLGLYILASLVFGEPWHMITSFPQYLLMVPSYISVLNVYAFANVHDVSWGTKGDNKTSTDLGIVDTGPNTNEAKVSVPTKEDDVEAYVDAVRVLSTKPPKTKEKPDPQTQQEDYYRRFRTHVLLGWTLSNALLAAIIVTATGKAADQGAHNTVNGYMAFILFSIAGLALIRFVGAATYMLLGFFSGDF